MNFLHELLTFGIDWMYVLLSLLAGAFFTGAWFTNKKSYGKIPYSMLVCCILMLLTMLILGIFSNRIDSSGKEVAIYERDGRLTLQKDPGIYFGAHQAYYFSKNPIIICGNAADSHNAAGSVEIFKTKECTSYTAYTLDFNNFVQTSNTLTPNHPKIKDQKIFWEENNKGERNTQSLIKTLLQLEEGGSKLPSYVIRKVSQ